MDDRLPEEVQIAVAGHQPREGGDLLWNEGLCGADALPQSWWQAYPDQTSVMENQRWAIEICSRCPVRTECVEASSYLLPGGIESMIRGGMLPAEQRNFFRRRQRRSVHRRRHG